MSHHANPQHAALSSDAVTTMLHGRRSVPFPPIGAPPLVVRVSARTPQSDPDWDDDADQGSLELVTPRAVWVEDATSRVRARLVGPALARVLAKTTSSSLQLLLLPCQAVVHGYVTCEVNPGSPRPVLLLANLHVLSYPSSRTSHHNKKPVAILPPSRVPGGHVFEFLERTAPRLLAAGRLGRAGDGSAVTGFLEHVRAVETLQSSAWGAQIVTAIPTASSSAAASSSTSSSMASSSSSSPGEAAGASSNEPGATAATSTTHYRNHSGSTAFASAIAEFERSQLDRQGATLASHASRNPETADAVVAQHRRAVEAATRRGAGAIHGPGSILTADVLCEWHRMACDGLMSTPAGQTRTRAVRVGNVSFRPASQARSDLVRVCDALAVLEASLRSMEATTTHAAAPVDAVRTDGNGNGVPMPLPLGTRAALYASIVFFAIVDTHAFADGNGRLARIAANYALRKFGFPVPIALFATPSQRREYTQATVETRRNLYLLARGDVDPDTLVEAYEVAGAFTPLLRLFLDRMVGELTNLVHDKQRRVQEEVHHQEARLFRERAAQGTCLICFDEAPNITTLCCGKAVHLNCMAEWLTTNTSCPNCRREFPALPQRIARQPVVGDSDAENDENDDDEEATTTEYDGGTDDDDNNSNTMSDQDSASARSRMSDQVAARHAQMVAAAAAAGTEFDSDDNTTTVDDGDDGSGPSNQPADAAAAMSTDDTTTAEDDDERCLCCSNKAARDCQNRLCGRCCQSTGQYQCARHGMYG